MRHIRDCFIIFHIQHGWHVCVPMERIGIIQFDTRTMEWRDSLGAAALLAGADVDNLDIDIEEAAIADSAKDRDARMLIIPPAKARGWVEDEKTGRIENFGPFADGIVGD